MNRRFLWITVFLIAFLLAGCAAPDVPVGADAPLLSSSPTITAALTSTPAPIGSRLNPYLPGTAYPIRTEIPGVMEAEASITLTQVLRGQEAWDLLLAANQFNDAPAPGKEYLLAEFAIECESINSDTDYPASYSSYDFRYSSSKFSVSDLPVLVYPEAYPQLSLTLYEGASGSGWVCFEVDQSETSPYAVFMDALWFRLQSPETTAPFSPNISEELSSALRLVDNMLLSEMGDLGVTTSFSDNTYIIHVPAPAGSAKTLILYPDTIVEDWRSFLDAMRALNQSAYDLFMAAELKDIHVVLTVESDTNPSNMLAHIRDGLVLYDVLSDASAPPSDAVSSNTDIDAIIDWMQTADEQGYQTDDGFEEAILDDEELRFIATYFHYCMTGQDEKALCMVDADSIDEIDLSKARLDITVWRPAILTAVGDDGMVIALVVKDKEGNTHSFGSYRNPYTGETFMVPGA